MNGCGTKPESSADKMRVAATAVSAAVAIGVAAWLLKWLIKNISQLVTANFDIGGGNWWLIFVPVAGIMATAWIVRNVVRMPLEHSTRMLKTDLATKNGRMPARLTVASLFTSALTLGFGGSAGSEGPIAYTGAAIGSNLAQAFRMNRHMILVFLACGAGAGIAAIFKAPVGGMFFTLEVLRMELGLTSVLILATMCLISALTAYVLSGCTLELAISPPLWFDASMLAPLVLLAVGSGVYSAYYLWVGHKVRSGLRAIATPVARNLISGLILGLMLFLFPALYGEGYGVLSLVANGNLNTVTAGSIVQLFSSHQLLLLTLAGILITKTAATYSTNSGGGVAGDFAPAMFAGGIAGIFIAMLFQSQPLFGTMPPAVAVVCGMAAVMSGVIRAPLMTIFIVVEMTASLQLLLPVAAVSVLSLAVSRLLLPDNGHTKRNYSSR